MRYCLEGFLLGRLDLLYLIVVIPILNGCTPPKAWKAVAQLPNKFESRSIVPIEFGKVLIGGDLDYKRVRISNEEIDLSRAVIYLVSRSGKVEELYNRKDAGVISLAVRENIWWSLVRLDDEQGRRSSVFLIRSDDEGKNWKTVSKIKRSARQLVVEKSAIWVLASNETLWRSIDQGKSWGKYNGIFSKGYGRIVYDGEDFYSFGKGAWRFDESKQIFECIFPQKQKVYVLNDGVAIIRSEDKSFNLYDIRKNEQIGFIRLAGRPIELKREGKKIFVLARTDSKLPMYIYLFESNDAGKSWKQYRVDAGSWYGESALGANGRGAAISKTGVVSMP